VLVHVVVVGILSFTADEAVSLKGKKKDIHQKVQSYACGSDEREARPARVRGN